MDLFLDQLLQVLCQYFLHDLKSLVIAQFAMLVDGQELGLNLDREVFFGGLSFLKAGVLVGKRGTGFKQAIAASYLKGDVD